MSSSDATRPSRLDRRTLARASCQGAAGLCAAWALGGCGLRGVGAVVAQAVGRPLAVTFALRRMDALTGGLPRYLDAAIKAAAAGTGRRYSVEFVWIDEAPESWFPLSPQASVFAPASAWVLVDQPTIPMPDLVLVPHAVSDGFLATRALDLGPLLSRAGAGALPPQSLLRQGLAYAPGRGTIQAGLPAFRRPMVCAVGRGVDAPRGVPPWTAATFTVALARARPAFPSPAGPLAYVPFAGEPTLPRFNPVAPPDAGGGLAGALALGYGSPLANASAGACLPLFTAPGVLAGLWEGMRWTGFTPAYGGVCAGPLATNAAVYMAPFPWAVGAVEAVPPVPMQPPSGWPAVPANLGLPTPAGPSGWRLAPLPVFPRRAAVPTWNLDLLVWKDGAHAAAVAQLALALLSTPAQAELGRWSGALAADEAVAAQTLATRWTDAEQAGWIATSANDVTKEDAWGVETDANHAAQAAARSALGRELRRLTGARGGFLSYYTEASSVYSVNGLVAVGTPSCPAAAPPGDASTRAAFAGALRRAQGRAVAVPAAAPNG